MRMARGVCVLGGWVGVVCVCVCVCVWVGGWVGVGGGGRLSQQPIAGCCF